MNIFVFKIFISSPPTSGTAFPVRKNAQRQVHVLRQDRKGVLQNTQGTRVVFLDENGVFNAKYLAKRLKTSRPLQGTAEGCVFVITDNGTDFRVRTTRIRQCSSNIIRCELLFL
jgi:hypothetical protein